MPNCFQLREKESGEVAKLVEIDEKLCEHLGVECDPVEWCRHWVDTIGFSIAVGLELGGERLREHWKEVPEQLEVIEWLEQNYTSTAWAERR